MSKLDDGFWISIMLLAGAIALILAVNFVVYECKTFKLAKAHQAEWDRRKKVLEARGMREIDIDGAFVMYCDELMKSRGYCGACLPKR